MWFQYFEIYWDSERSIFLNVLFAPRKSIYSVVTDLILLLGQLSKVCYLGTFNFNVIEIYPLACSSLFLLFIFSIVFIISVMIKSIILV